MAARAGSENLALLEAFNLMDQLKTKKIGGRGQTFMPGIQGGRGQTFMPGIQGGNVVFNTAKYATKLLKGKDGKIYMVDKLARQAIPFYDRVATVATGVRNDFQPKDRKLLEKIGNNKIVDITVGRKPVFGYVHAALGVLSRGKWKELMKKYGVDEFFHLFIIVRFVDKSSGKIESVKIQKNEVVDLVLNPVEGGSGYESIVLDNPSGYIPTINEFLMNGKSLMGKNFFPYNPFTNNCQDFVTALLEANGWLKVNSHAKKFIKQDINELAGELDDFTKNVSGLVTDLAAKANVLVYGTGAMVGGGVYDMIHSFFMGLPIHPAGIYNFFAPRVAEYYQQKNKEAARNSRGYGRKKVVSKGLKKRGAGIANDFLSAAIHSKLKGIDPKAMLDVLSKLAASK